MREGEATAPTAYGIPLTPAFSFKYLWRFLSVADDNFLVVVRNIRQAWQKWAQMVHVLGREGVDAHT